MNYRPNAGSLPDRVLAFLEANPEEELNRRDIAVKFDVAPGPIETLLQLPVTRGCLARKRNKQGELVWVLGENKADRQREASNGNAEPNEADPLPVRQIVTPHRPAAPIEIDPAKIVVRKGIRLKTPAEQLEERFDELFAKFEVGDRTEFDADWEDGLRKHLKRWGRGRKVSFVFVPTAPGKVGMERRK